MRKRFLLLLFIVVLCSLCACQDSQETTTEPNTFISPQNCVYIIDGPLNQIDYIELVCNFVADENKLYLNPDEYTLDEQFFREPGIYEAIFQSDENKAVSVMLCSVSKDWINVNASNIGFIEDVPSPERISDSFGITRFDYYDTYFGEIVTSISYDASTRSCTVFTDNETIVIPIDEETSSLVDQYLILADFGSWERSYVYSKYLDHPMITHDGAWGITIQYADGREKHIGGEGAKNRPARGRFVEKAIMLLWPDYSDYSEVFQGY